MTEEDTAGALRFLHALMAETWDNHYAEYHLLRKKEMMIKQSGLH